MSKILKIILQQIFGCLHCFYSYWYTKLLLNAITFIFFYFKRPVDAVTYSQIKDLIIAHV